MTLLFITTFGLLSYGLAYCGEYYNWSISKQVLVSLIVGCFWVLFGIAIGVL